MYIYLRNGNEARAVKITDMKLFSLQKSEYPGKDASYTCHFETGTARHPYIMMNLTEEQHNSLLQSLTEAGITFTTKVEKYSTINYL